MIPEQYDAWYRTPRGCWIGDLEYRLLARLLAATPGASMIDVGCGTGYFTRRFAAAGQQVTGVDPDRPALEVARAQRAADERYVEADARSLPFLRGAFEYCVCVTALCFIAGERAALAEMLRVTRRRIVLGLLNRHSLLYRQKGRHGGSGAYRGAHWHAVQEVRELFSGMPCGAPRLEYAVFFPSGRLLARSLERLLPGCLPFGAFLAVCAEINA